MAEKNVAALMEAEYAKCRQCIAELEAVRDKLPKGYLHTIIGFGEEKHYHYLPSSDPEKPDTLTYLDESCQNFIDALAFKKKINSDLAALYHNLSIFPEFLNDYLPYEKFAEALEKLTEDIKFPNISRRRCISWKVGNADN